MNKYTIKVSTESHHEIYAEDETEALKIAEVEFVNEFVEIEIHYEIEEVEEVL